MKDASRVAKTAVVSVAASSLFTTRIPFNSRNKMERADASTRFSHFRQRSGYPPSFIFQNEIPAK